MGITITPNQITCPECTKQFVYNKVNGVALVELSTLIQTKKQMHCRLTLTSMERALNVPEGQLPKEVKKAILDGYNDLARDISSILGFGNEVE